MPCVLLESEQATPVGSIKDVVWSSVKVPKFDKHPKKAGWHIGRNFVEITIKMKTIVRKPLMLLFFLWTNKKRKQILNKWMNEWIYIYMLIRIRTHIDMLVPSRIYIISPKYVRPGAKELRVSQIYQPYQSISAALDTLKSQYSLSNPLGSF